MSEQSASDAYQEAFHVAFAGHLGRILDALPIRETDAGIDVPCGTGFYTERLARRVGPGGRLVAADSSAEFLDQARRRVANAAVEFRQADAYRLPFADRTFDYVFCAQSLITLDPVPAVREMRRVVTDAGLVAILEGDEYHHVVLPWPVELEAALPLAMHAATVRRFGDAAKLSPARRLRRVLQGAGFRTIERITYTCDRAAPYDEATAAFLEHHVRHLRGLAYPHLSRDHQATFDRLADPDAEESLFHRPSSEFVCINVVYLARP